MAEAGLDSSQSSSMQEEGTPLDSDSDTEAGALLSSQNHEEVTRPQDIEKVAGILKEKVASSNAQFLVWTGINTLATIGIVSDEGKAERTLTTSRYLPISKSSRILTYAKTSRSLQLFTSPLRA